MLYFLGLSQKKLFVVTDIRIIIVGSVLVA